MFDSNVYIPAFSKLYREFWVQPYEGEPRALNEDFDEDWLRRFLARGVQVKISVKNFRYWMLVFYVCVLFSMAKSL